uniref:Putative secreted peptide n=1 Tax=Anopheles braziliensis TaxID=58242 RepID=A0A2M3ZTN0_9DIPT
MLHDGTRISLPIALSLLVLLVGLNRSEVHLTGATFRCNILLLTLGRFLFLQDFPVITVFPFRRFSTQLDGEGHASLLFVFLAEPADTEIYNIFSCFRQVKLRWIGFLFGFTARGI